MTYSSELRLNALIAFLAGEKLDDIAEAFNCSPRVPTGFVDALGLPRRPQGFYGQHRFCWIEQVTPVRQRLIAYRERLLPLQGKAFVCCAREVCHPEPVALRSLAPSPSSPLS